MSTAVNSPAGLTTPATGSRPPAATNTFPFPSKNRSRTPAQRWVRKCGRSITNSEAPHLEAVYDQVVSAELAEWNQDPELLTWLINLR